MGKNTAIAWCDHTFNAWWGCRRVSPGCDHCYAADVARRFNPAAALWDSSNRRVFTDAHWREPLRWARAAAAAGESARVFAMSMGDVFDLEAPAAERERFWELVAATPELDWLLLTKRIGNAAELLPWRGGGVPWENVWLGATCVNQVEWDRDVPKLLATPAAVRFVSAEPLLGPLYIAPWLSGEDAPCPRCGGSGSVPTYDPTRYPGGAQCPACRAAGTVIKPGTQIDQIIIGGESGRYARPCRVEWIRDVVRQGAHAGVPVFVKQLGERPIDDGDDPACIGRRVGPPNPFRDRKAADPAEWPPELRVREFPRPRRTGAVLQHPELLADPAFDPAFARSYARAFDRDLD